MGRMNLSGWTPEAIAARKQQQANDRQKRKRAKEKEERDMAKKKEVLTESSPEVVEIVNFLREWKFKDMIEPIAKWERHHKQALPIGSSVVAIPGETYADYHKRFEHHRQMALAKFYSQDFFARQKAKERKNAFDNKEALEAQRAGITVFELQKRRKIAAAADAKKDRQVQRLADKIAA